MADYTITEAGFGADLGAEKFFDIKCRMAGLKPDVVVLVATIRALKYNGYVPKADLSQPNLEALKQGTQNLEKHIENLQKYDVPVIVAVNAFTSDTEEEIGYVRSVCEKKNVPFTLSEVWAKGGEGAIELANMIIDTVDDGEKKQESHFHPLYKDELSIEEKITTIAKEIYGADGVTFAPSVITKIKKLESLGFSNYPICMAKTQYSLSDNPKLLGRPTGFEVNIRDLYVSAGAGFIVALTGDIMTMPGLPKEPAAYRIDVNEDGIITGLF